MQLRSTSCPCQRVIETGKFHPQRYASWVCGLAGNSTSSVVDQHEVKKT